MIAQLLNTNVQETILVRGARQLLTMRGVGGPRRGAGLGDLGVIRDGAVLIRDGKILEAGPSRRVENLALARHAREINATGRIILPGFVDCLARLWVSPFGTSQTGEAGPSHGAKEISGLPAPRLEARARTVLNGMARHGTTSVSVTTIAAPSRAGEWKMLRVLANLAGKPLDVIPAYGGAGFPPPDFDRDDEAYVESLCSGFLPTVARRRLARFAVLNNRAFTPAAARRYVDCARRLGLHLIVWTGRSSCTVAAAVEMEAAAVLVEDLTDEKLGGLPASSTVAMFAPAHFFHRRGQHPTSLRAAIDSGAAVALGSGFGVEQGATYNMQMAISLACSEMDLSPAEAISSATINAAHALGCGAYCGSLEPGKRADLLLLNAEDYGDLIYGLGINHVHMVVKNGAVIYREGEVTHWPAG